MKFVTKRVKHSIEKKILTTAVLNTEFLKAFQHIYRQGCFSTPYGDWIASTCVEYFQKFQSAPKKDILDLCKTAIKKNRVPKPIVDVTLDFVKGLEYDNPATVNYGYLADKAREFIVLQLHKKLLARLQIAVDNNDADLCEKAVSEIRGVKLQVGQVCKPFEDKDKVRAAFLKDDRQLFKLAGALGRMLNPQFKPKRFIALLGTAKRGKTWWLYKLAKTAKRFGNHVAIFAAGDEDEDSSIVRFGCMLTGKNNDDEYTGEFAYPVMDCVKNQTGECFKRCRKGKGQLPELTKEEKAKMTAEQLLEQSPKHVACSVCRNNPTKGFEAAVWYKKKNVLKLYWQEAWKSFTRFHRFTPKSSVRLFTYSSNTLTASEIDRQLDMAEDCDDWVPTVLVIDYPDIMASELNTTEKRHSENDKWINIRRIGQTRSLCTIVVSQSNMGGYGADSLVEQNVNEDRRKLDHVTWLGAINQTDEEKRKKIARIGPIVQRKGKYDTEYQVMVLQALEMGNPCVDSQYVYRPINRKNDKKGS